MDALDLRRWLAANLKTLRGRRGLSREKLAELANVSVQTVAFIESCRTWVSDRMLSALASALDVDVMRFFVPDPLADTDSSALRLKESIIDHVNTAFSVFSQGTARGVLVFSPPLC